ncbi:hypothetical protein P691DRAFT_641561, partial [Macrolepiota fuliginosa MF-IS2]
VTSLVIACLLFICRHHIKLMGATDISEQYMGIVTMLVESYALESVWPLASLALLITGSTGLLLFSNCNVAIEIITYLLVIYRVSTGRAWSKKAGQQISRSLEFNHG